MTLIFRKYEELKGLAGMLILFAHSCVPKNVSPSRSDHETSRKETLIEPICWVIIKWLHLNQMPHLEGVWYVRRRPQMLHYMNGTPPMKQPLRSRVDIVPREIQSKGSCLTGTGRARWSHQRRGRHPGALFLAAQGSVLEIENTSGCPMTKRKVLWMIASLSPFPGILPTMTIITILHVQEDGYLN